MCTSAPADPPCTRPRAGKKKKKKGSADAAAAAESILPAVAPCRVSVAADPASTAASLDPQRIFAASFCSPTEVLVAYGSPVKPTLTRVRLSPAEGGEAGREIALPRVSESLLAEAAPASTRKKRKREAAALLGAMDNVLPAMGKREAGDEAATSEGASAAVDEGTQGDAKQGSAVAGQEAAGAAPTASGAVANGVSVCLSL